MPVVPPNVSAKTELDVCTRTSPSGPSCVQSAAPLAQSRSRGQVNTFAAYDVPTGNIGSTIEGCTSSDFGTLISGGYSISPSALIGVAATVDGPSGANDWRVDLVNNSGRTVSVTIYT